MSQQLVQKSVSLSEDGPSFLTWSSSMFSLWHISVSSLYISFRLSLYWVILNTLCLSYWQISLASRSRAFRCICSSSRSNRSILWYSAVIITLLKATYFWGNRRFKASLMFIFKRKPQILFPSCHQQSHWQTFGLRYLLVHFLWVPNFFPCLNQAI